MNTIQIAGHALQEYWHDDYFMVLSLQYQVWRHELDNITAENEGLPEMASFTLYLYILVKIKHC